MKLKDDVINFLCELEGYHQLCKMIHWSTNNNSEHELTDMIDDKILDYQDRLAEAVMGHLDTRIGIGDLKTLLPNAKNTGDMLKELSSDILSLKKEIGDSPECAGLQNIMDDFKESVEFWKFKRTLK